MRDWSNTTVNQPHLELSSLTREPALLESLTIGQNNPFHRTEPGPSLFSKRWNMMKIPTARMHIAVYENNESKRNVMVP